MAKTKQLDGERCEESASPTPPSSAVATLALRLITMAASLQMSKAQEDGDEETSTEFDQFMMIYTVLVMIFTLALQTLWKVGISTACSDLKMWLFGGQCRSPPAKEEEPEVERPTLR